MFLVSGQCEAPLGMEDGRIPDSAITASSQVNALFFLYQEPLRPSLICIVYFTDMKFSRHFIFAILEGRHFETLNFLGIWIVRRKEGALFFKNQKVFTF